MIVSFILPKKVADSVVVMRTTWEYQSTKSLESSSYVLIMKNSNMNHTYKVDEGYSEETRSQSGGSDIVMGNDASVVDICENESRFALPKWLLDLSESERRG